MLNFGLWSPWAKWLSDVVFLSSGRSFTTITGHCVTRGTCRLGELHDIADLGSDLKKVGRQMCGNSKASVP